LASKGDSEAYTLSGGSKFTRLIDDEFGSQKQHFRNGNTDSNGEYQPPSTAGGFIKPM